MLAGFSGSLVSEYFVVTGLRDSFAGELGESTRETARREMLRWRSRQAAVLGPVHSARGVYDAAAAPLLRALGFEPVIEAAEADGRYLFSRLGREPGAPVLLTAGWGQRLDACWRLAVARVLASRASWCFCSNGRALRLVDARRALARSFVEFDLELALDDDASFGALWGVCRRDAFRATPLIERVVLASSRHTAGVCQSLRHGVLAATGDILNGFVRGRRLAAWQGGWLDATYEQALTIIYRVLFLLFAESRGLVPLWHPTYRDSYSVEALRDLAERPAAARGFWETLQAMSRLAHAGCHAGSLHVTPFNGRLFAPSATPLGEDRSLDDESARRLVLALSTMPGRRGAGRARIAYRDLGVEQLGAVYESVLDYRPSVDAAAPSSARGPRPAPAQAGCPQAGSRKPPRGSPSSRVSLVRGGGARKATGTFYTPRAITTGLVARVLGPLVAEATPDRILSLRVLDPSMGSGAFLVAACRFLSAAYEAALTDRGGVHPSDISDEDRRGFRRLVAQRCLYGVDRNPMAVQVARLSLWLCTLAPDRPLTFLDHRLLAGDSLVGASLDDIRRPPPGTAPSGRLCAPGQSPLPLFDGEGAGPALRAVLPQRARVAEVPDDSLAAVREKERVIGALAGRDSPLAVWKTLANLWCSLSFKDRGTAADAGVFFAVVDAVLRGRSSLPDGVLSSWLSDAGSAAADRMFFHWTLEFPEVFFAEDGRPRPDAGFDAVVGNPPWDMVRDDNEGGGRAGGAPGEARRLLRFCRTSGIYKAQGEGHGNLFQLFVERAFRLSRAGGRLGLVVPWGLAADCGSARLRRMLLDQCQIDEVTGFENSRGIFPIHRSVRFMLFSATTGGSTGGLRCRLGLRDADALDSTPDPPPVVLPRPLLERLSPGDLSIPDVRSAQDLALLEKIAARAPALGAKEGWGVGFGRELNATDDARHFTGKRDGLPVLEGKHVEPFSVSIPDDVRRLPVALADAPSGIPGRFGRARLAYRDVASATNRLTLIAAIVPAGCATVHTLFCLKTPLPLRDQAFLCGILNSLVANYLVRLRVTTHVTVGIVSRLPVPRPPEDSPLRRTIAALSFRLQRAPAPEASSDYVRLQAHVARLYGLTTEELGWVLSTFPLIDGAAKEGIRAAFEEQLNNWATG